MSVFSRSILFAFALVCLVFVVWLGGFAHDSAIAFGSADDSARGAGFSAFIGVVFWLIILGDSGRWDTYGDPEYLIGISVIAVFLLFPYGFFVNPFEHGIAALWTWYDLLLFPAFHALSLVIRALYLEATE